jgi:Tol biopolymer transport system component
MTMPLRQLVWRDRAGKSQEAVGQVQPGIREFSLSPDGRKVAVTVDEPAGLWILDLERATTTRLAFGANEGDFQPSWAPSGAELAYTLNPYPSPARLMRKSVTGTEEARLLAARNYSSANVDWSRDGRFVIFSGQTGEDTRNDILYLELNANGEASEPQIFLSTSAGEQAPRLSPDGRFVAYVSDESGRREVYVRPFPSSEGRWQVSVNGGTQPRWRRDGAELFYVLDNTVMMSVLITAEQSLGFGQPRKLFESEDLNFRGVSWAQYDVSADGQRFLTSTPAEEEETGRIYIVENWYEEFRDRQQ